VTTVAAASLSITEEWEGVKLSDGHTRAARQAAFSPDGRRLVTVGEDAKVIVWDFEKRQRLATFTDHTDWIVTVAFSPDGKWVATGSWDHTVIVWDANKLEKARTLTQHQGPVIAVAFSPDGQLLASISMQPPNNKKASPVNQIVLWSVERGQKLWEIQGVSNADFGYLFFSSDGRWLSLDDGQHWDAKTGQQASDDVVGWSGGRRAISRDGRRQASMGSVGGVGITDLIRRKTFDFSPQQAHQDSGRAAAFSPDGRLLATGADDIILWDAETPKIITHLEYNAIVWHLSFSPDGRWLVSSHGDGSILVWDAVEGRRVADFNGHSGGVRGVAFSPDGKQIASASEDGSVIIWDADVSRKEAVLVGDGLRANAVAFSQDGTEAAQCENGLNISLWDLRRQQPRITFGTKYGGSFCIAISPDGRWLASTQAVYDSADGHPVVEFDRVVPESWQMYGVAFSPDGRWLACVTPLRFIHLFDTEDWQLRNRIEVSDSQFICVSFAPDNKHLVTGDDEGTVRLWEIEPLRQVAVLGRHTSRIKSVSFSPDGREVASAGDDQTIRLWDIGRRRLITTIGTHTSPVLSVAFSPDGRRLVSGGHDHSVRIYTRHRTLWGYRFRRDRR
jgi:WD40 repeat protein